MTKMKAPKKLDSSATKAYQAREKRLTVGQEQLQKDLMLADVEVKVVAQSKEWGAGVEDSDDEADASPKKLDKRASLAYDARETRLAVALLQMEKEGQLADAEVKVTIESKEWGAGVDSDDEDESPKKLDKSATTAYQAREKRLTVGQEQMEKDLMLYDAEVKVVAETKESCAFVDSDDDDVDENPKQFEKRASVAYDAREKRLSVALLQMEKDGVETLKDLA